MFNANPNFRVRNNQNQFSNNQRVQPIQSIEPQAHNQNNQQVRYDMYLNEVITYCRQLGSMKLIPSHLLLESRIQISIVADRLNVYRIQAMKTWKVSKKGEVIISAYFLGQLFYSRNMLNKKCCSLLSSKASEITLMRALQEQFPELLLGIICPEEVPISKFSKLKSLAKANPLVTVFALTAVALGIWFQFSTIYLSLVAITAIFLVGKHKRLFTANRYLQIAKSAILYIGKKLHSFIGSCIVTSDNSTSVPKTTKFSNNDEEMYLDLEMLEVVKPRASYKTNPLNHPNQTTTFDDSNQTSFLN